MCPIDTMEELGVCVPVVENLPQEFDRCKSIARYCTAECASERLVNEGLSIQRVVTEDPDLVNNCVLPTARISANAKKFL